MITHTWPTQKKLFIFSLLIITGLLVKRNADVHIKTIPMKSNKNLDIPQSWFGSMPNVNAKTARVIHAMPSNRSNNGIVLGDAFASTMTGFYQQTCGLRKWL